MNWLIIFLSAVTLAQARIVYIDPPRTSYPVYFDEDRAEQASKDLDMTFSAGEANEEDIIYPVKKTNYVPEQIIYRGAKRPVYYQANESPNQKIIYRDPYVTSEPAGKFLHFNPSNKGEVVLELRVIANNNNV
ncbi:uncharacterized protein LOC122851300 [Aphidius gifuensis]|uniref:uncharacterized protein LOC122851300 n=1 Tax=Aphidius gifuensis TaxID=684658 RepID=UPI001CDC8C80|nr:uncharacterized protein LOC122851300 [Aphidius gifuensis]